MNAAAPIRDVRALSARAVLMRTLGVFASPATLTAQVGSIRSTQGVPAVQTWPEQAPTPDAALTSGLIVGSDPPPSSDTLESRRAEPIAVVTLIGASVGSFAGLVGGAYVGLYGAAAGAGEYDGVLAVLLGAGVGSVFGSGLLGASMSGNPTSEVFSDALHGALFGLLPGVAGGVVAGSLTQGSSGWLMGFALGQGAATTMAVLRSRDARE